MLIITNKKRTFNCARPSRLGNPYVIGKDGTRAEVIEKYKIWLNEQIKNKNPVGYSSESYAPKKSKEKDSARKGHKLTSMFRS